MSGQVRIEPAEAGIARVLLDHPGRRNAMSVAMWDQLRAAFVALDGDDALRCVIVTGAGDEAFSAGADISEFESTRGSAAAARGHAARLAAALRAMRACRHPVLAAIRGPCIGGGLQIACFADIRIAGETARFSIPAARLGITLPPMAHEALAQLVGPAAALRLLLTGEAIGTDEAFRLGLVATRVADAEVAAAAAELAGAIAAGAPLSARHHKRQAQRLADRPPTGAEEDEDEASHRCFDSADFREGTRAFLEKRRPRFTGR